MSYQLVVVTGPDKGKKHTLQEGADLLLGRGERAFYRLSDPRVSRAHCQVLLQGDQVTVLDTGSTAGVRVNGTKIEKKVLEPGDVIAIGDTELRLLVGDFDLKDVLAAASPGPQAAAPTANTLEALNALGGKTLSHYEIGHILGAGVTGLVFFATDTKNNRPVAFKVLLPEFSKDEHERERFVRGMKTAMPLRHPNLISVYGAGRTGDFCWVAMEYVAGESMTQVIERIGAAGMLDWRYAFKVAVHVCRALEYAHGQNIVHRNVTPTNILLQATDKVVKLGDLVLAKALEGSLDKPITRPGELVGTVAYLSPERTRGSTDLDARSDLYQLGATLYALLTGQPPFTGKTLVEVITRIRQTDAVKPTKYQLAIPALFEGFVLKLLTREPGDRFATATDALKELDKIGRFNNVSV
jgi:serine/threonine protein kinase